MTAPKQYSLWVTKDGKEVHQVLEVLKDRGLVRTRFYEGVGGELHTPLREWDHYFDPKSSSLDTLLERVRLSKAAHIDQLKGLPHGQVAEIVYAKFQVLRDIEAEIVQVINAQ